MKKSKLFCLLAALALLVTLATACGSTPAPSTPSAPASQAASLPAGDTGDGASSAGQPVVTPIDGVMEARLTPAGATVTSSSPGALVLESDDDVATLKAFYEGVLAELGAQETTNTDAMGWNYTGTYDNGKSIAIAIAEIEGMPTTIAVVY